MISQKKILQEDELTHKRSLNRNMSVVPNLKAGAGIGISKFFSSIGGVGLEQADQPPPKESNASKLAELQSRKIYVR